MRKIQMSSMYGQFGPSKMNRAERRRIQRENGFTKEDFKMADHISKETAINVEVLKRMDHFLTYFYVAMRQNKISAKRCQKIMDDTAILINESGDF